MAQHDAELRTWEGKELPVWRFTSYTELENFLDMGAPTWITEIFPDLPETMWGIIYRNIPMSSEQAIALIHVDEDTPPQHRGHTPAQTPIDDPDEH